MNAYQIFKSIYKGDKKQGIKILQKYFKSAEGPIGEQSLIKPINFELNK